MSPALSGGVWRLSRRLLPAPGSPVPPRGWRSPERPNTLLRRRSRGQGHAQGRATIHAVTVQSSGDSSSAEQAGGGVGGSYLLQPGGHSSPLPPPDPPTQILGGQWDGGRPASPPPPGPSPPSPISPQPGEGGVRPPPLHTGVIRTVLFWNLTEVGREEGSDLHREREGGCQIQTLNYRGLN